MRTGLAMRAAVLLRRAAFAAAVAIVLGFVVGPLVCVVWVAFFANKIIAFPPEAYTTAWFASAWRTESFREGFLLSAQVALMAMSGGLLIGVPASLALVRYPFPGRQAISTLLLAPLIVPGIVIGSSVFVFYIRVETATDFQLASTIPGLVLAHILVTIPWTVRLVTASLVGMDRAVEEAAANLGANPWVTFYRVTLPVIKPGIIAAALFSFIVSFIDLEKSLFLVGPGRTTLPIAVINYLEWTMDPTIAAVATMQIAIVGAALLLADRYVKLSRAF